MPAAPTATSLSTEVNDKASIDFSGSKAELDGPSPLLLSSQGTVNKYCKPIGPLVVESSSFLVDRGSCQRDSDVGSTLASTAQLLNSGEESTGAFALLVQPLTSEIECGC